MKVLRTVDDVLSLEFNEQCLVYNRKTMSFKIHTLIQLEKRLMKLKGLQNGVGIYAYSKQQLANFLFITVT